MQPFHEFELRNYLSQQLPKVDSCLARFSNDEIMANDEDVLYERIYAEVAIEPIRIGVNSMRSATAQRKIEKWLDPTRYWTESSCGDRVFVDGIVLTFSYCFYGDPILFRCKASTFLWSSYKDIEISGNTLSLAYSVDCRDVVDVSQLKVSIEGKRDEDLNEILQGVSWANKDVADFNEGLRAIVHRKVIERKEALQKFYAVTKIFEVPIPKDNEALGVIHVKKRIAPIAHTYTPQERNYSISDSDYCEILSVIRHTSSTMERTPSSYILMKEEDLRNVLLASLNGIFKGDATGETFRNAGKTDICIEAEDRSAFVAECKIWTGQGAVEEAIKQLDSYLTWRDSRAALIYFVRRKDFLATVDAFKKHIAVNHILKVVKTISSCELDCAYNSESTPGQVKRVRVIFVNLYFQK